VRALDDWLDSRQRHVEANLVRRDRGEYDGTFLTVDRPGWTVEALAHQDRVCAHFDGRPDDLLVMDIAAGEGWSTLCPFLGVAVPEHPFPRRG
jgi:hypothetical protein